MAKEMTTMSFSFGPKESYVLHIPMERSELQQSIQKFAHALMGASLVAAAQDDAKKENAKQLAFAWSEPLCGNAAK